MSELISDENQQSAVPPVGHELRDSQFNVYNVREMNGLEPSRFAAIRFDPNNTCNLHCVYCHNHRSTEIVPEDDLRSFIFNKVISVDLFQVGCIMEPTLDARLADLMLVVAQSPAKPTHTLMLQTNGLLLHRHDTAKFRDAGLNLLSVSVDAAEPETQKELRNGTSLDKVVRNLDSFRNSVPEAAVDFITTVTTSNVGKMSALVALGLQHGVTRFIFREVFYYPENDVVDHSRMPSLLLREGQFETMKQDLTASFGGQADFIFSDGTVLEASTKKMKADSFRE